MNLSLCRCVKVTVLNMYCLRSKREGNRERETKVTKWLKYCIISLQIFYNREKKPRQKICFLK